MSEIILTSTVPLSLNLFFRGLLRELSSDYEVVALSSPGEELAEIEMREGVRTIAVPMCRHISPLRDFVSLCRLVRVFCRERPRMVHSITPKAGLLSMIAARIAGVPVRVHTFTGLVFPTASGFRRRLLMLTDKLTCRCATRIIAEGEGVRDDLLRNGVTEKSVEVLGYGNVRGVDMQYYDRTDDVLDRAADSGLSSAKFTFIFVGRIVRDKGIDELAEAFCRVVDDGLDVRLLLVGEEEKGDPVSEAARQAIRNNKNICRVGWQEDVRPYYAVSDVLILPSYREGFPNAVLEAGAMGLPSIVTDVNGSREIIIDGENGVIVPPRDSDALYKAMKLFAEHPERAEAMGKRARPLVAGRFEQGFVREQLKKFYGRVMQ